MTDNSSREIRPNDRWSVDAKENDEYWLCECGVAREKASTLMNHLDSEAHIAERVDTTKGTVTGFIVGGMSDGKYSTMIPNTAQINREDSKNDPMFKRP